MNWQSFLIEAQRTSPINIDVKIEHCKAGVVTEFAEWIDVYKRNRFYLLPIDVFRYYRELGDMLWYISEGYVWARIETNRKMIEPPPMGLSDDMAIGVGLKLLSDLWNKKNQAATVQGLLSWIKGVLELEPLNMVPLETLLEATIAKLRVRYPEKWGQQACVERNEPAEREAFAEVIRPLIEGGSNE